MSFQPTSDMPSSWKTRRNPVFPILKLPDEILLMIADEVANADTDDAIQCRGRRPKRTLIAFSLVNKHLRSVCVERMFKTLSLLRKNETRNTGLFQFYAGVAQGNPEPHTAPFNELFESAPLHLLAKLECFAVHQFWQSASYEFISIPRTLRSIICSSNMLRSLHIDGDWKMATALVSEMDRRPVNLARVKEVVLSLEMTFVLEYTPNVERLSNKVYSGNGPSHWQRTYNAAQVSHFLTACQSLPKLKTLELTAADFDGYFNFDLPRMSLQTLAISSDAVRSDPLTQRYPEPFPITAILRCIQNQPDLVEVRIPETERLHADLAGDDGPWLPFDDLSDLLPAAIIAATAPKIQRIHVGWTSRFDIAKEGDDTVGFFQSTRSKPARLEQIDCDIDRLICWHDGWDSWKEPLVYEQLHCSDSPVRDFLSLRFADGDEEERTVWIETDGSELELPCAVVVNLDAPIIQDFVG